MIIVTGGSGSLGRAIIKALELEGLDGIIDWSLETGVDVSKPMSIAAAALRLPAGKPVSTLIHCAGTTKLNWFADITVEDWDNIIDTNAGGIFLVTKALLHRLRGGTILTIASDAARKPMTNSLAYNASKAAAVMMAAQLHRELHDTHQITSFSISPGKIAGTNMSSYVDKVVPGLRGWTPEYAQEYQLRSLAAGEEINLETLAEFIAFILSTKDRHIFFGGKDLPYGG